MIKTSKTDFFERREDVILDKSILGESWHKELEAIDKHEILAKICGFLGDSPMNFATAEKIFDNLRYELARYVIHYEYSKENSVRNRLLVWLDSKAYPDNVKKINEFGELYLK